MAWEWHRPAAGFGEQRVNVAVQTRGLSLVMFQPFLPSSSRNEKDQSALVALKKCLGECNCCD